MTAEQRAEDAVTGARSEAGRGAGEGTLAAGNRLVRTKRCLSRKRLLVPFDHGEEGRAASGVQTGRGERGGEGLQPGQGGKSLGAPGPHPAAVFWRKGPYLLEIGAETRWVSDCFKAGVGSCWRGGWSGFSHACEIPSDNLKG